MRKNTTYYRKLYLKRTDRNMCEVQGCDKYSMYGSKYCCHHKKNLLNTGSVFINKKNKRNGFLPDLLKSEGNKPRKGVIKKCLLCGADMYVNQSKMVGKKYCSRKCQFESQKTNKPTKCKICKASFYVATSTMLYRPRKTCSDKCYRKYLSKIKRGKNSTFWKGGRSTKRRRIRASVRIKNWREKVFKRDNYTCQACKQVGGYLQAHHIKQFSEYPEKRFVIKNGITLCKECHKKVHFNK